ncbi:MAG: XdhC family protein [Nitrospinae bacterium]|nr:XdhC family protein [Nitrospinota bacterium]
MSDVFEEILRLQQQGQRGALCTIISSKGSLPMSGKAKMLVGADGTMVGTVGGGCLEADVWAEAQRVIKGDISKIAAFILTEQHAGESGLNCGGRVEIFIEPVVPNRMDEVFAEIARIRAQGEKGAIATVISSRIPPSMKDKAKLLLRADGTTAGAIGEGGFIEESVRQKAEEVMREDYLTVLQFEIGEEEAQRWALEGGDTLDVFIEPIVAIPTLYLFGGGHVSLQIAKVAKSVGFKIVVIDDRPAFANQERFPMADETRVEDLYTVFERLKIDDQSYIVAVTRGHQHDEPVIEQAIRTDARYIGMIGSKRKITRMWKKLIERGADRKRLADVHAPIGLEIGADNPEEIAVSIVAQLIEARRGRKDRKGLSNSQRVSAVAHTASA